MSRPTARHNPARPASRQGHAPPWERFRVPSLADAVKRPCDYCGAAVGMRCCPTNSEVVKRGYHMARVGGRRNGA